MFTTTAIIIVAIAVITKAAATQHDNHRCPQVMEKTKMVNDSEAFKYNETLLKCEPNEEEACLLSFDDAECSKQLQCNSELFHPDYELKQCVLKNCSCLSGGYCLNDYSECTCYEGFHRTTDNLCEPVCEPTCEHAVCVGPNQCECWLDYHITSHPNICEQNDLCRLQLCENGECLLTGVCKCKLGFLKSFAIDGHIQCETIADAIGKLMSLVLGIPLALASVVLLVVYIVARRTKKKITLQHEEPYAVAGSSNDGTIYCYENETCHD